MVGIFAPLCPYGIIPTSIEKRKPPEPDVKCQISDGSWVAFEVTEAIDDLIAQRNNEAKRLKNYLKKYLEISPFKYEFYNKYRNAIIFISPEDRIPRKPFCSEDNINKLLKCLTNLPDEINQLEYVFSGKHKYNVEIYRSMVNYGHPIFDTYFGSDFNDYIINTIIKKFFRKTYKTDLSIDLLIHYNIQPGPFQWDVDEAIEFIKNNIKKSRFRRAWIFSTQRNRILGVYPPV